MNELQRAEYLSVLGISSYVPRFVLPLAPSPRQAKLPPAEAIAVPGADPFPSSAGLRTNPLLQSAEQITTAPTQRANTTVRVLKEISALTGETQRPPTTVSAPIASPQKAVKPFVLNTWRIGAEVLVIDSHEPGAALPLEALFNNIIRALFWHQLPRQQERLHWPLTENRFGPAEDASQARDTFSSWLEASCARLPVKSIWLMGSESQEFCSPIALTQTISEWNGAQLITMPSLSLLLQEPEHKGPLWKLLRSRYPAETRAE
ncbi:hypothetical protein MO867_02750 [Microbulbifer sp. OS29]|uniref:Uncharacterized protein n=1 Tax=Microbulbifer okhotskensis TaxID=2926617 RepID=A0A9X2EKG9_9GAMM|nr:hypothetical protein [Microbulbifer okhotskensis]MCO1333250.1 hypothetical protein [Microbulbifer okhotskensis]